MAGAQVVIDLTNSPSFEDSAVLEIPEAWVARCMRFGRPGQRAGFCTLAEDLRRPVQRPTPPPPGRGGLPAYGGWPRR